VREVFFNARGLRAGWRLLLFLAIFAALSFVTDWTLTKVFQPQQRPFLDPVSFIEAEAVSLALTLIVTSIMGRLERRHLRQCGIPGLRETFGRQFWQGIAWGVVSASMLFGLIAAFGGYRILGLAIHSTELWYFIAEELQFRAYLLATTADGIGFWAAAILLSVGFGALHYFFKPHERWEDFASTGLLGLFMCFTLRRTGSLAFAIGFHAAFDFANLFLWSGQNAGEYAVGHLLQTSWTGPQWVTGGLLGPEASRLIFPLIAIMFIGFDRLYRSMSFPPKDEL
jgi:membrane protease YdiL (CAAX protease family)